jgi:SAM-dependent methyltransferase
LHSVSLPLADSRVNIQHDFADMPNSGSLPVPPGRWRSPPRPVVPWDNATLKTRSEWRAAVAEVLRLGLPAHVDPPKNWDAIAALRNILNGTSSEARVLDAGAERYSVVLPWLARYGYRHLVGINIAFGGSEDVGTVRYQYGDLTRTDFATASFDAITCLSVIEHGVDFRRYFLEMNRLLKPGGLLITSTDYFEPQVDTRGQRAFGVPIRVFCERELRQALTLAALYGFQQTGPIDLRCLEQAIRWEEYDLAYTFLLFTLRKWGPREG